jgi:damage-control phosphatase, subfamily I
MKIQPECVTCLLKRIIFETELSTKDPLIRLKTIQKSCTALEELYNQNVSSAEISTKVHKIAYDTLGDKDPYAEIKEQSNKVALTLVERVNELIEYSDDPLRITMLATIIGNLMDFGIAGASARPEHLSEVFEDTFAEDLGHDDTEEIKEILKTAKNVVLFTDNCGEIVFDKILCRELKKFSPNIHLTLVVKGEPIISDATIKDAMELKFTEVVDEILNTGCFAIGLDFRKMPPELRDALKKADLIICKGMANYEAFSETDYKPIAYLLRTKCSAIAKSIDLPMNINVVKLIK